MNIIKHNLTPHYGINEKIDRLPHKDWGHTGAWGTPDFKITETISDWFGGSRNNQGGSELRNDPADIFNNAVQLNQNIPLNSPTPMGPQKPATSGVLGANTNQTTTQKQGTGGTGGSGGSGGGGSQRDAFNQLRSSGKYAGWDEAAAWEDFKATGGGNQGGGGGVDDIMRQIEDIYNSGMGYVNSARESAEKSAKGIKDNVVAEVGQQIDRTKTQGEELLGDVDVDADRFKKVLATALEEAVRSYNALKQQGIGRFGGGSSAGQAVGELAQREFFREQGKVNEKSAEGDMEFAREKGKIRTYVQNKIDDFEMYKTKALTEIENNLRSELARIDGVKYDLESNRARDKMGILQDSVNRARQVQEQDYNVKLQLATATIEQMQKVQGRAFTPAEIQATLADFGINLNVGRGAGAGNAGGGRLVRRPGEEEDEISRLG